MMAIKTSILLAAASTCALGAYGCSGSASDGPAPYVPRAVTYQEAKPGQAAGLAGLTFERSRTDGDATVFEGVAYETDALRVTADSLRVVGLGMGGGGFAADAVLATGLTLTPKSETADETPVTVIAGTVSLSDFRYDPGLPSQADDPEAAANEDLAAALRSVSAASAAAESVVVDGPGGTGAVAALSVEGYHDGILGAVTAGDIELRTDEAAGSASDLLAQNPALADLADTPLVRLLTTRATRITATALRWEGFDASAVTAALARGARPSEARGDVLFGDLTVHEQRDFVGDTLARSIEEIVLGPVSFDGVLPEAATLGANGILTHLDAYLGPDDEEARALLSQMGLTEVPGSMTSSFAFDRAAGRAAVAGQLLADGLYGARMTLDISGISAATDAPPSAGTVSLENLRLSVTDDRALDLVFGMLALDSDNSAMALRQQAMGLITLGALQGGALSPRVPDYAGALSEFVGDGGTLTFSLTPPGGLTAASAQEALGQGPAALLDAADLRIERTE